MFQDCYFYLGNCTANRVLKAVDCADVLHMGHDNSGLYEIWPMNKITEGKSIYVYCDMNTNGGGWTVSFDDFA